MSRAAAMTQYVVPRVLGFLLALLVGDVLAVRRRHVVESLRRANVARPGRVASAMYRNLGRGLFELVGLALRARLGLRHLIGQRVEGDWDRIRTAIAAGPGAVLATAHTGNWDLVGIAAAHEFPLTIVTKRFRIRWLDRLWQRVRARCGVQLAAVDEGVMARIRNALGRGEAVAMIVDQAPERHRATTVVPFLGAPARVDLAPALVAMRQRVPLVAVFAQRRPGGGHVAHVAGVLLPPAHPTRIWAEQAMKQVTWWLEELVLKHPEQWLWMHRRWK